MPVDLKDYRIVAEENGGYSVYRSGVLCSNTKAAMREIAALIGMQYDTNWTTRQFGARLLKAIGGDTLPANSQAPASDNAAVEKAKAGTIKCDDDEEEIEEEIEDDWEDCENIEVDEIGYSALPSEKTASVDFIWSQEESIIIPATIVENNDGHLVNITKRDIIAFMQNNQELLFNERDFQMHLAVWLRESKHYDDVDVEYYIPYEKLDNYIWKNELRLDIVVRKGKEYLPIELKYKTKHPAKTENASAKAPAKSSGCAGGVRGMSGCAGVPACSLKEVRSPGRTTEKPSSFEEEEASSGTNTANNAIREDAIEAMARLGYKDAGTRKKIDDYLSANPNTTLEDVIKNILQQI